MAYTLLGVAFNEQTGDCAFLILDPHYTGGEGGGGGVTGQLRGGVGLGRGRGRGSYDVVSAGGGRIWGGQSFGERRVRQAKGSWPALLSLKALAHLVCCFPPTPPTPAPQDLISFSCALTPTLLPLALPLPG